jgi:hypothetical protein
MDYSIGICTPLTTITDGKEQPTYEAIEENSILMEENSTFLPLYGVSIPINHSTLRHSIITQGKLVFDDFMNSDFLRKFQEIRQTVTIADAFCDSQVVTLRIRMIENNTSLSWKRLRAILAMFCLNQLMYTSLQLRHILQQMHPNVPIMI